MYQGKFYQEKLPRKILPRNITKKIFERLVNRFLSFQFF